MYVNYSDFVMPGVFWSVLCTFDVILAELNIVRKTGVCYIGGSSTACANGIKKLA